MTGKMATWRSSVQRSTENECSHLSSRKRDSSATYCIEASPIRARSSKDRRLVASSSSRLAALAYVKVRRYDRWGWESWIVVGVYAVERTWYPALLRPQPRPAQRAGAVRRAAAGTRPQQVRGP